MKRLSEGHISSKLVEANDLMKLDPWMTWRILFECYVVGDMMSKKAEFLAQNSEWSLFNFQSIDDAQINPRADPFVKNFKTLCGNVPKVFDIPPADIKNDDAPTQSDTIDWNTSRRKGPLDQSVSIAVVQLAGEINIWDAGRSMRECGSLVNRPPLPKPLREPTHRDMSCSEPSQLKHCGFKMRLKKDRSVEALKNTEMSFDKLPKCNLRSTEGVKEVLAKFKVEYMSFIGDLWNGHCTFPVMYFLPSGRSSTAAVWPVFCAFVW